MTEAMGEFEAVATEVVTERLEGVGISVSLDGKQAIQEFIDKAAERDVDAARESFDSKLSEAIDVVKQTGLREITSSNFTEVLRQLRTHFGRIYPWC